MAVTMEFMTQLMDQMKLDLAKKDDIQQLKTDLATELKKTNDQVGALANSVDAARKKIDTVDDRMSTLEKRVKSMEEAAACPPPQHTGRPSTTRTSTGSRTSASSSPQTCDDWVPRVLHWRGWAPYGSNDSSKISRTEAEQVHAQILDRVPEDLRPGIKLLSPFVKNHSVSAEILAASYNDTKRICDLVNLELQRRPIRVRNVNIKGAVETSPARRRALRAYFEARELVRQMNVGYIFEECARSFELWDNSACVRLGFYDRKREEGIWDVVTCATVGINIPNDISGEATDNPNATQPGEELQAAGPQQQEVRAEQVPVDADGMDDSLAEDVEVVDGEAAAENNAEATKRMSAEAQQESNMGAKKQRTLARSSTS